MKVLVAMSGGVDSSVAALLLRQQGHEVVGATMKLWGGPSDTGCCSVADVEDARRVSQQLGMPHHVFNFTDDFEHNVVGPYVDEHAAGRTPNPCVECNRHLKFDRFLGRAMQLGFDAIATGHHARIGHAGGTPRLLRGVDAAKDQSYVLAVLGREALERTILPIGDMTKAEVREAAGAAGLRTAAKADSQDVCFIAGGKGGRAAFLEQRIELHPGRVLDERGAAVGEVPAVQLVTIGQRRGVATSGVAGRRYVTEVDVQSGTVRVGPEDALVAEGVRLDHMTWTGEPPAVATVLEAQSSAHGAAVPVRWDGSGQLSFVEGRGRRVAPGQLVALYDGDAVVGSGVAC